MPALNKDDGALQGAGALLSDSLVWDMTMPWGPAYAGYDTILPSFHQGGVDVISLTVMGQEEGFAGTLRHLASVNRAIDQRGDRVLRCRTVDEIGKARAAGKLALIYNLQETLQFEHRIEHIALFYELGVRHALLAYNAKNFVGDGCAERTDEGLSRWGVAVVREMNRVGMLVDGTHSGHRTTMEAMEVSERPFIFSHCNAYGVVPHYRNIKDDQIKACAATGGVIGVNGLGEFLHDHEARSKSLFRHIDYMVELVGPEHVGLGLDYVADHEAFWDWVEANDFMWPLAPGIERTRSKFAQPGQVVELVALMQRAGYDEPTIRNILGLNWNRVAGAVWR